MKFLMVFWACFLFAGFAFAEDPGMPDTLIVGTVYADLGQAYVDVNIFAVTDEDVVFYNTPITWATEGEDIEPSDVFYYYPLTHWDETFDSVLVDEHYIRMLGWCDLTGMYLNTDSLRLRCWAIRFTIDSLAPPQVVTIDTTYDPINGQLIFGLIGGIEILTPVFIPGAIFYGVTSENTENTNISPTEIAILQNYPNPFNASTTIEFTLPEEAEVELSIYNILGQKIATLFGGLKTAGENFITWDAGDAPSGIYFARLESGADSRAIKMLLLR